MAMGTNPSTDAAAASDYSALELTCNTEGYQLLRVRVQFMLTQRLMALASDLDAEKTAKARGYIEALNTVLDLPKIMMGELQKKADRQ